MKPDTVFCARSVITMNPSMPFATHIAVADGRILAVGSAQDVAAWGDCPQDDRFSDCIIMPGFVEGHAHAWEGGIWAYPYIGYEGRYTPHGNYSEGSATLEDVIAKLCKCESELPDPHSLLFAWGFDPIFFASGERMTTQHLDQVSRTRPIIVMHSSAHLINVNSRILEMAGITAQTQVHGVLKDEMGAPTGELMEMAAHYMAYKQVGHPFGGQAFASGLLDYANSARNVGVTTATDLFANFDDNTLSAYDQITRRPDFHLRLVPAMNTQTHAEDGVEVMKKAKKLANDKLYFGLCKVMTDGSIQGFTGRLRWPGYFNGKPNGLWNLPPQQLTDIVKTFHAAGLHLHIHTNGDEAIDLMLEALAAALESHPRPDHRHTLQHCQMADSAQFRRMATLGVCANLFANHIYYWGDQHSAITMGPERASRMDAARTAIDCGVKIGIHSDAPVTPLAPLFTAWCAINRLTRSGALLGEAERITVFEALHAITLGPAYTLKLDHLIGSIEVGKFADFAILEDDPMTTSPEDIKNIRVWGTVVGGHVQKSAKHTCLKTDTKVDRRAV